jgi:prepilin-type processing-associated H-X9-DG protein
MTLPTANYMGVFGTTEADDEPTTLPSDGTIVHDRRVRMADLERGTSRTLLVGERTMAMVPSTWLGVDASGEDAQCRLVGSAMTRPNCEECDECEFSSRHSGGTNFLWADGHVELIADDVETALYRQYSQRFAR